jgi:hypothetical protein
MVTGPVVAPDGTTAVICVADTILYDALVPLNATRVADEKLLPVMVTVVPTGPCAGDNDDTAGGGDDAVTV